MTKEALNQLVGVKLKPLTMHKEESGPLHIGEVYYIHCNDECIGEVHYFPKSGAEKKWKSYYPQIRFELNRRSQCEAFSTQEECVKWMEEQHKKFLLNFFQGRE